MALNGSDMPTPGAMRTVVCCEPAAIGPGGSAMSLQDWMNCDDSEPLVAKLEGKVSERKLRLFGVTCCRRIERAVLPDRLEDARHTLDVAERFADGDGAADTLSDTQWRGEFCTGSDQR